MQPEILVLSGLFSSSLSQELNANSNIVEIQEKRMKRIGFGRFLKFNFLKFCKGIN